MHRPVKLVRQYYVVKHHPEVIFVKLLDDFWREVKRTLDERDIPNDL